MAYVACEIKAYTQLLLTILKEGMLLKSVSLNTDRVDCFNCDLSKDFFFHVGLSRV